MSIDSQNEAKTSHYLGLDYGRAKVGLATADSETKIAFPYGTIPNDKNLYNKLLEIIQKKEISKIIIGIPVRADNEKIKQEIEKLGEKIKETLSDIEVEFHNEMFSTKMAQENLKERGAKNINTLDDAEAAKIILQSWIDA